MLIFSLLAIPYFTIMSRAHGGGKPDIPWGLDAFLLAAPYIAFYPVIGWWNVPAYFGAVLGLRFGHGRFFDYDLPFKPGSTPEKVEYLISPNLPVWAQKALGMALTGLAATLLLSIALAFHGACLAAIVMALSGALKAVAYLLPKTEQSEYCRGAFLGLGFVGAWVVV